MKYRIYNANKAAKVEKHRITVQKHYDDTHYLTPNAPWFKCCPVVRYDGKFAVPLATETYPAADDDDGIVDNIDRPIEEQMGE